jgi:hypothetical protein
MRPAKRAGRTGVAIAAPTVERLERRRLFSVGQAVLAPFDSDGAAILNTGVAVDGAGDVFTTGRSATAADQVLRLTLGAPAFTPVATFAGSDGGPAGHLVVDAAGDLFGLTLPSASVGGSLWELKAGGSSITTLVRFGAAVSNPGDLTSDAAGDLFWSADDATQAAGGEDRLYEYPADGSGVQVVLAGDADAGPIASDSAGDLFGLDETGADTISYTAFEVPAADRSQLVGLAAFTSADQGKVAGLSVDARGDLFITTEGSGGAFGDGAILEIPSGTGQVRQLASVSEGLILTSAPLVDGAGNVFAVALSPTGSAVVELPVGSDALLTLASLPNVQVDGDGNGPNPASDLAHDAAGNLYGVASTSYAVATGEAYEVTGAPYAAAATPTPTATAAPITATLATPPPATLGPGQSATLALTIGNGGPADARGGLRVALYASPNVTLSGATRIGTKTLNLALPAGGTRVVSVGFKLPARLALGSDTILATLTPLGRRLAAGTVTTAAANVAAVTVARQFGVVGKRRVKLAVVPATGGRVTFALSGPGTGVLGTAVDGLPTLVLTDTTAATTLTITPAGAAIDAYTLGGVGDATASLGRVVAPHVNLAGTLTVGGTLALLQLRDLTDATVTFNAGASAVATAAATLSLGDVTDADIQTNGLIAAVTVGSWSNTLTTSFSNLLYARDIGSVTSGGTFAAEAEAIDGIGPVKIGGSLTGNVVSGTGVGDVSIAGDIDGGSITAHGFGSVTPDATSFPIGSITVGGSILGAAAIEAGIVLSYSPMTHSETYVLAGGSIGPIMVAGTLSADAHIAASTLPATVSVQGASIATAGNPVFTLPVQGVVGWPPAHVHPRQLVVRQP